MLVTPRALSPDTKVTRLKPKEVFLMLKKKIEFVNRKIRSPKVDGTFIE